MIVPWETARASSLPHLVRRHVALGALLLLATPANGQLPRPAELIPGALFERVTSPATPAEQYALYVPTTFNVERRTPLVIAMDPRGRALAPIGLLRSAADRFGWVIISSYNTRSDVVDDPNRAALNTMLADAQRLVPVDSRRLYLVGFSGTARQAWRFAYQLGGHVAGIIGFGAGLPPDWTLPVPAPGVRPPAFFGGAGNLDFNFEEMVALDRRLDGTPVRHRLVQWDGSHGWPPADVMHGAVEWLELQAIQQGLRPGDAVWVDSLYRARLDSARAREAHDDLLGAWERYQRIPSDFEGLRETSDAEVAVARLGKSRDVVQQRARQRELSARSRTYLASAQQWLAAVRSSRQLPALDRALRDLEIAQLARAVGDTADVLASLAAGRLLEYVFVAASFYESQVALDSRAPGRALLLLDLAETIRPGTPSVCAKRKVALAQLGRDTTAVSVGC